MAFSTAGDKSFLVLSRAYALHEKCVCGRGRQRAVKYSWKENKHHVPWVLTHSVLLKRNKHHRNISQQEDTTELPVSASLTTCPQGSRHCGGAGPQSPAIGHPERGSCFGVTHHFLNHSPIPCTPNTCKQKGQLLGGWLPQALSYFRRLDSFVSKPTQYGS